jgi:hypothetical protein
MESTSFLSYEGLVTVILVLRLYFYFEDSASGFTFQTQHGLLNFNGFFKICFKSSLIGIVNKHCH